MSTPLSLLSFALQCEATSPTPPLSPTTEPTTSRKKPSNVKWKPDQRSPFTTSQPVFMPGQAPTQDLSQKWTTAPPRVHHYLDNVTDYHRKGTHGWQHAQEARLHNTEAQIGTILEGRWPPPRPFGRQMVIRKDVDFNDERDGQGDRNGECDGEEDGKEDWEDDRAERKKSVVRRVDKGGKKKGVGVVAEDSGCGFGHVGCRTAIGGVYYG